MVRIEYVETAFWQTAVRGMRNPHNSWDKSDSKFYEDGRVELGEDDLILMKKLIKGGSDHRKFMRQIMVACDITAPLYWWKEFDTYKVGTVANSTSTMHKIHYNEITLDDFSHEKLMSIDDECHVLDDIGYEKVYPKDILKHTITMLNKARDLFITTNLKKFWWQMIQLLPSSYNQTRTVTMNYEVLKNLFDSRSGHKLDVDWGNFLNAIYEECPYPELYAENYTYKEYLDEDQEEIYF